MMLKATAPLLALACCATLSAADMTLDDLRVGTTVSGPEATLNDMKGKVVYVIYWGTH